MANSRFRPAGPLLPLLTVFLSVLPFHLAGQPEGNPLEQRLMESVWRYAYTLHATSNTVLHRADRDYAFFLYFRYDHTYRESLQGEEERGNWSMEGRTLSYRFQHVERFEVVVLNETMLVLEFTQRNSQGVYQYHFVRVAPGDNPFSRPANELPTVTVEAETEEVVLADQPLTRSWRRWRRRDRLRPGPPAAPAPLIQVELNGGGYYGGIDPVFRNFIRIKTDGRLVREFQSEHQPLLVIRRDIGRDELEAFAAYVLREGFFDMDRLYDCGDPACEDRKSEPPTPVPLRLSITYGLRKHVVTVAIFGDDDRRQAYVEYPEALGRIIGTIEKMANTNGTMVVK